MKEVNEIMNVIDLSNLSDSEALKEFLEQAEIYSDTKGNTKQAKNFFDLYDFDMFSKDFEELEKNVGSEHIFIFSINCSDRLNQGYRMVNILARFATTKPFKLSRWGIQS